MLTPSKTVTSRVRRSASQEEGTLRALRLSGVRRVRDGDGRPVSRLRGHSPYQCLLYRCTSKGRHRLTANTPKHRLILPVQFPEWSRSTPLLKGTYMTNAMIDAGGARFFTVKLGPGRIAKGYASKGGLADDIKRQMDRELERALGRKVELFFVVEKFGKRTIGEHLHGVIGIAGGEVATARKALQKVAGDFDRARAVRIQRVTASSGAAGYIAKDATFTRAVLGENPFRWTQSLARRGRALYEADRVAHAELLGSRSRGEAPGAAPPPSGEGRGAGTRPDSPGGL